MPYCAEVSRKDPLLLVSQPDWEPALVELPPGFPPALVCAAPSRPVLSRDAMIRSVVPLPLLPRELRRALLGLAPGPKPRHWLVMLGRVERCLDEHCRVAPLLLLPPGWGRAWAELAPGFPPALIRLETYRAVVSGPEWSCEEMPLHFSQLGLRPTLAVFALLITYPSKIYFSLQH